MLSTTSSQQSQPQKKKDDDDDCGETQQGLLRATVSSSSAVDHHPPHHHNPQRVTLTPGTTIMTAAASASASLLKDPPPPYSTMDTLNEMSTMTSTTTSNNNNDDSEEENHHHSNNLRPSPSDADASMLLASCGAEDAAEADADADTVDTANANNNRRRVSKRAKKSTLVHIDGYAVKRENNYLVKGGTYEFNKEDAGQAAPKKKKQRTTTTSASTNKQEKKKKRLSPIEEERVRLKEKITANIRHKAQLRRAFLRSHVQALQPFCDASVLENLVEDDDDDGKVIADSRQQPQQPKPVYIQPDAIVGGELRDYQLEGLSFMSQMYERNIGMILGDEMGLGKTLQTIALICHIKEAFGATGPSLVIVPLSVLYSWCDEIKKWAPSLNFKRFHTSNAENLSPEDMDLGSCDIVITTYEMTKNPMLQGLWRRQYFNLLVLDEGHRIKSRDSQIAHAVRKLHAENRIILTGTPLANNLVEMWSLINFLVPDIFTTEEPFAEAFNLTTNVVDSEKLTQAHYVLKIFMLRRLKQEVEKLLPKKIETKVLCPLSTTQIWWYKAILLKDLGMIAGNAGSTNKGKVLNNLIMQLRKCCIHPYTFPDSEDIEQTTLESLVGSSGKLAVLDMLLQSLYKKGHRVTLFSQFTSVLDILDDYCSLRGWKYCRFDGSTSRAKRNYIVNDFNKPGSDKFVFLMSTRSGGMGLNLQSADTCILFDSDWNPQPDIQAMARTHRIGQKKIVHVYRLVTQGTVEERMIERAEKKLYLDRMVTRDGVPSDSAAARIDDDQDTDRLLNTLKFGCNAVFGSDGASKEQKLPSLDDIEVITDRSRTEEFSQGKLKAAESNANDFDACKEFTGTTQFAGIDFKKIRDEYSSKKPKDMSQIAASWKRQRKNRIKLVQGEGTGYGKAYVPVLASNDYDLETGEKSVFDRELKGRNQIQKSKKKKASFESQDFCQVCGDGGELVLCPRCPIGVHLKCVGLKHPNHFQWCTHHYCTVCQKAGSAVGGFLYTCSACPNAYCEDHLPKEENFTVLSDGCERMENLGHSLKHGVYCLCSDVCSNVAKREWGYKPAEEKPRPPCPSPLDVSSHFGEMVDDSVDAPEELVVTGKRARKAVKYFGPSSSKSSPSNNSTDDPDFRPPGGGASKVTAAVAKKNKKPTYRPPVAAASYVRPAAAPAPAAMRQATLAFGIKNRPPTGKVTICKEWDSARGSWVYTIDD